ncbi:MAG: hypothetical protein NT165_02220 [Candidatus Falkowbacteria bacterium]|nr:hypothetical protein [Candidatus Falkowbacteria bacterium]
MKKFSKFLFSLLALSLLVLPAVTYATVSGNVNDVVGITNVQSANIALSQNDPIVTATNLINTAMMFLGLLAVVIILVGGFKWMTAMGNDDNIKKAKALMSAGVVGLVIILAAWGIARFIVNKLATTI